MMMKCVMTLLIGVAGVHAAAWAEPEATSATKPAGKVRVVRRSTPSRSVEEALQRIESLMDASARRLAEEFDTGDGTQDVQTEVIEALDDAIRASARQQRDARQSKQSKSESRSAGRRSEKTSGGSEKPSDRPPAQDSKQAARGGGPAPSSAPGDRAEVRRGWGFLPQRDREAIMQGSQEEFSAKYREQIERYYRAIAERAEEGR